MQLTIVKSKFEYKLHSKHLLLNWWYMVGNQHRFLYV